MSDWDLDRLCGASLAPKKATYKVVPTKEYQIAVFKTNPELFEFEAVSVGDDDGQAFIIPLDESSEEVADLVITALKFYKEYGDIIDSENYKGIPDFEAMFDSISKSIETLPDSHEDVSFVEYLLIGKQLSLIEDLGKASKKLLTLRGVDE